MQPHDLHTLLKSLSINPPSSSPLQISENDFTDGTQECQTTLVGKFFTDRDLQLRNLKPAMEKSWRCKDFTYSRLRNNIYQFFFKQDSAVSFVLSNGPWCFDNILLVLKPWTRSVLSSDLAFNTCLFWIHVRGLPRECVTEAVGLKLVASMCGCEELQIREVTDSKEKFFRIRALVEVTLPLARGLLLDVPFYGVIPAAFQYERLSDICYHCGFLSHTVKHCNLLKGELTTSQASDFHWGSFLHAPGNKGLLLKVVTLTSPMESEKSPSSGSVHEPPLPQPSSQIHSRIPDNHCLTMIPFLPSLSSTSSAHISQSSQLYDIPLSFDWEARTPLPPIVKPRSQRRKHLSPSIPPIITTHKRSHTDASHHNSDGKRLKQITFVPDSSLAEIASQSRRSS